MVKTRTNIFYFVDSKSSFTSTSRVLAISTSVSNEGCISFVHHRDTVAVFLFSFSANHLFVLPCSAKTTFSLFIAFLATFDCVKVKSISGLSKYNRWGTVQWFRVSRIQYSEVLEKRFFDRWKVSFLSRNKRITWIERYFHFERM